MQKSFFSYHFSARRRVSSQARVRKDRVVQREQVLQGKLTPACEFPFVVFEVKQGNNKVSFPVQEDLRAERH